MVHSSSQSQEQSQQEISTVVVAREDVEWWYPKYPRSQKPFYDGNKEALGWACDGIGRAIQFVGAGAFFGTALLRIATDAACPDLEPGEECDEPVYGIKPSSLLTTYTMIVGISSAAMLPLMGAIIDYTSWRLRVGQITSGLFIILIFPQIFLTEDNFFAMAIIQICISFIGWVQTSITYAYLPELTNDELLLNDYTKSFTISSFTAMVLYLAVVIGGVSIAGYGDDDIMTSKVGMGVAFACGILFLVPSWTKLFGPREAMHTLPTNRKLWSAGFIQLWETGCHIYKTYPSLKWFYISIAFSDAGLQALVTIAITYLTDQLQFTARENGIAIMIMLIGSVPGAILSNWTTKKSDPIRSSMVSLVILIIAIVLFAIFLKGPDQHLETYILSFVWGLATGWKWTCDRLVASSIIPDGQDAELMGVFLFSGQCLSWIPPLVFTAMNEAGVSQQIGVATLDVYFLIAMGAYLMMGGYKKARRQVNRTTAYVSNKQGDQEDAASMMIPAGVEGREGDEGSKEIDYDDECAVIEIDDVEECAHTKETDEEENSDLDESNRT